MAKLASDFSLFNCDKLFDVSSNCLSVSFNLSCASFSFLDSSEISFCVSSIFLMSSSASFFLENSDSCECSISFSHFAISLPI